MTEPLRAAIEQLYRVFARYPLNPNMDGSPIHADLAKWNAQLAAKLLRELTEDDLVIFYFKVLTTWGEEKDFKHFLPRILELLTTFPMGWEEWVALDKLNYGHWSTWPETEQQAICDYLWAFWEYILTTADTLADWFCGNYSNVYPGFEKLLRRWEQADARGQVRLGLWVADAADVMLRKRKLPGFHDSAERGPVFYAWLTTEATVARLEAAFLAATDEGQADQLSLAVQLLEAERKHTHQ